MMNRSLPENSDGPRGVTISGAMVVVGLVLLVLAGAGLAVAMYLALGPFTMRRDALTELVAEQAAQQRPPGERQQSPSSPPHTDSPEPADKPSEPPGQTPLDPEDAAPRPSVSEVSPPMADGKPEIPPSSDRVLEPSAVALAELSPLSFEGIGVHDGGWRGPLTIDGRVYQNSVLLRPAKGDEVAQIGFALKARYARLSGFVALAGSEEPQVAPADQRPSSVLFRVYGDGNLLWESEPQTKAGSPQAFVCEVRGVEILTLVAESHVSADPLHFAWGDLELLPVERAQR